MILQLRRTQVEGGGVKAKELVYFFCWHYFANTLLKKKRRRKKIAAKVEKQNNNSIHNPGIYSSYPNLLYDSPELFWFRSFCCWNRTCSSGRENTWPCTPSSSQCTPTTDSLKTRKELGFEITPIFPLCLHFQHMQGGCQIKCT